MFINFDLLQVESENTRMWGNNILLYLLDLKSKWLLFNAKWAIIQLYHGENKLHLMIMMSTLY
jgi:hypothetical protein